MTDVARETIPCSMEYARLLGQEVLARGPKRIVRDDLEMPDGTVIDWYYVDTPPAVMIVPITADGDVVLVRQWRQNIRAHGLELPAGAFELKEGVESAARRELLEETGYALAPGAEFDYVSAIYARPSETTNHTHIMLARPVLRVGEPAGDNLIERYFDMSVVTMPVGEALAQIGRQIAGAETITALTLACR